ncbi:MAG: helix-turn-helix domain-containing protein [Burkholderiales bacterium]|nr:helix-turn-helix domain-containing protein [Burkholderiales bacterium]
MGRIGWRHLPDDLLEALAQDGLPTQHAGVPLPQDLDALSLLAIQRMLEACRGNISEAARKLGISRQTLYRKLARRKDGPVVARSNLTSSGPGYRP